MHNVNRIEFAYDGFGRVTGRTYSNTSGATRRVTTYTYQDVGTDKTTTLLKSVNNSGFGELGYEYDAVGNITQITKNGTVQETYTYDALNQLKTVTRNGVTTEYNYQNGNITSVTQNGTVIKTYSYTDSTWSDLLTSFNGQTITYDEIGNPLQYRDGMSFTWAKGRQLQSVTKDGLTASYTYDENGLRLSKTVNGVTTNIFRANGQMVGMNSSDGKDMTFMLDGNGNVYGVHYDHYSSNQPKSETYYFAYNAQGDVIGIYEFSGRLMATYDYDEWGNCTVNVLAADNNGHAVDSPDHIAYANPFRYRGYFYDAETGFYYLNSRYYDPGTGRFVNADGFAQTGQGMLDKNMFAYCENNPVNRSDFSGMGWKDIKEWAHNAWDSIKAWANSTFNIGTASEVAKVASSEMLTTTGDYVAEVAVDGLSYKNYAPMNSFSTVASGSVKNIGIAINNIAYTTVSPYLNTIKFAAKKVGIATIAAFAIDVFMDYQTYGHSSSDFNKAIAVDVAFATLGIAAGCMLATVASPVGFAVGAVVVGTALSYMENKTKQTLIGY